MWCAVTQQLLLLYYCFWKKASASLCMIIRKEKRKEKYFHHAEWRKKNKRVKIHNFMVINSHRKWSEERRVKESRPTLLWSLLVIVETYIMTEEEKEKKLCGKWRKYDTRIWNLISKETGQGLGWWSYPASKQYWRDVPLAGAGSLIPHTFIYSIVV